jgi:hypothetical protein
MHALLRPLKLCGVLAALVAITACKSLSVQTRRDPGMPEQPPTQVDKVLVLAKAPPPPFSRLGEIIVEPKKDSTFQQVTRILQENAAKLGADAVVVIANRPMTMEEATPGTWLALQDGGKIRGTVVGIAIKRAP